MHHREESYYMGLEVYFLVSGIKFKDSQDLKLQGDNVKWEEGRRNVY